MTPAAVAAVCWSIAAALPLIGLVSLLWRSELDPEWTMTEEEQQAAGCVIGRDYPEPIVDHELERERAIARYRAVSAQ
jgi:hypothetical protein